MSAWGDAVMDWPCIHGSQCNGRGINCGPDQSIPDKTPTLHQQLIDTIEALLRKHEVHHNSIEHAAARQLLRKIRGEA